MPRRDKKLPKYVFEFDIGKQLDDHDELAYLNFTSSEFGSLRFRYDGPLLE